MNLEESPESYREDNKLSERSGTRSRKSGSLSYSF